MNKTVLVLCLLSAVLIGSRVNAGWMTRPGTIADAISLPDDSIVNLDAVDVCKIRANQEPAYFVIDESLSPKDRLIVLTQPSPRLLRGMTLDVSGVVITLSTGERAIADPTIWGYTDSSGNLLVDHPFMKGLFVRTPWEWKTNLTVVAPEAPSVATSQSESTPPPPDEINSSTSYEVHFCSAIADITGANGWPTGTFVELRCKPVVSGDSTSFVLGQDGSSDTLATYYTNSASLTSDNRICTIRGTVDTDGTNKVLDVDSGPNFSSTESIRGSISAASTGTLTWAKTWADGHTFSAGDITGKVVTQTWADYLYVEEDSRNSGIRVEKAAHGHQSGERVGVVGTIGTNSTGERYIAATTITQNGSGTVNPIGMNNKALGGGDFAYLAGPPISGQKGIKNGCGLNNIGMLVGAWGKVTELDTASPPQWFLIDDGSSVQTKIAYPPFAYAVDDFAIVEGVSSCEVDTNGDLQRVVRPQAFTCTVAQAEGQNDPTNTSPVNFTVTFSEPVTGFTADDVTVGGVDGATKTVTGSGTTYNVAVGLPNAGTVVATVPSGVVRNSSGVWNYEATSTDNSTIYDNVAPTISTCTETPSVSSGQVTINYTGAADTGGSGLGAVRLYAINDGQYEQVGEQFGSSNSFTVFYTGNGTVSNMVLIAWDNAGNQSADKPVPAFTIDQTAPSQPTNVMMSHVLPTSRNIHASWDASSDANGIKNYDIQFWYTTSSGGPYALSSVFTTTGASATYDLGGYLSVDPTVHIGIRVWARDSAGNVSAYTDSAGVLCNKVKVGFLYYKCQTGAAYTYSNVRWFIDSYLTNVKYGAVCSGKVTYTTISSPPTTTSDYASYDVLFVALPASDFSTTEIGALQSFVNNQGFNKRLVLVGDYGRTTTGYASSAQNTRLNSVASSLELLTRFHAGEDAQPVYDNGIAVDYYGDYIYCPTSDHYLTNGVVGLWDAATSSFTAYVNPIAAMRDGVNVYPGKYWVVEEDRPDRCSFVFIHDCHMFIFEYDNMLRTPNLVGSNETDYDYMPDRNFRFVENLYTVFPQ